MVVFCLGILVCRYYDMGFDWSAEGDDPFKSATHQTNQKQSLLSHTISKLHPDVKEIRESTERIEALPIEQQPIEILRWAISRLGPGKLAHVTSFGISGIAITHMIQSLEGSENISIITIDTLHLFPETYALVEKIKAEFKLKTLHVYRTEEAATREEFEALYGQFLWRADPPLYDFLTKVGYTVLTSAASKHPGLQVS
jgi:hypothetical protein